MGIPADTIKDVTEGFKRKLIISEHSPVYTLQYTWEWTNLPSWVSVHFVRHHVGCTHFVQSQRNDRQDNYDRTNAPQNAPVLHRVTANAQSIINMSRRRLCNLAASETRYAWLLFLKELSVLEPMLCAACVPQCVYRNGLCPELFKNCKKGVDLECLKSYRELIQLHKQTK